jgi:hypothetical protein
MKFQNLSCHSFYLSRKIKVFRFRSILYKIEIYIHHHNFKMSSPGDVRTGKVQRGQEYPKLPGYTTIPAWSRGRKPWNALSPFTVGPVRVREFLNNDEPYPGFKKSKKDGQAYRDVQFFEQY